jgi:hypothetical protein
MKPETTARIERYINSIRSTRKREYAEKYLEWLQTPARLLSELMSENGPDRGELPYMAAQAVRLQIASIIEKG